MTKLFSCGVYYRVILITMRRLESIAYNETLYSNVINIGERTWYHIIQSRMQVDRTEQYQLQA